MINIFYSEPLPSESQAQQKHEIFLLDLMAFSINGIDAAPRRALQRCFGISEGLLIAALIWCLSEIWLKSYLSTHLFLLLHLPSSQSEYGWSDGPQHANLRLSSQCEGVKRGGAPASADGVLLCCFCGSLTRVRLHLFPLALLNAAADIQSSS